MAKAGYSVVTGAAVALTASTPKSVLGVCSGSAFGLDLISVWLGFDGTDSTDASAVVELCYATFATNGPGTNSTSVTPAQNYGRAITAGFTAARNWTSEPTQLTPIREFYLTPNGGSVGYDLPLGTSPDCDPEEGFVLRITAADAVNIRASMTVERC